MHDDHQAAGWCSSFRCKSQGRSIESSRTGQEDWTSNHTLHNMDEGDVNGFDQEFAQLAGSAFPGQGSTRARVPEQRRLM